MTFIPGKTTGSQSLFWFNHVAILGLLKEVQAHGYRSILQTEIVYTCDVEMYVYIIFRPGSRIFSRPGSSQAWLCGYSVCLHLNQVRFCFKPQCYIFDFEALAFKLPASTANILGTLHLIYTHLNLWTKKKWFGGMLWNINIFYNSSISSQILFLNKETK